MAPVTVVAMSPVAVVAMSPVAVVAMYPVTMMTPMAVVGMMSVSGPVLSIGTPLVFGPEDVVRPVSLRMSVMMGPTTLALVNLGFVNLLVDLVALRALGMNHVVGIISNDKDHLQYGDGDN